MALTDAWIKTATVPDGKKQLKKSDGGGLYLLVKPSGKYWRLKYRYADKEKNLALGVYPRVSLKAARTMREDAKSLLAQKLTLARTREARKEMHSRHHKQQPLSV